MVYAVRDGRQGGGLRKDEGECVGEGDERVRGLTVSVGDWREGL